MYYSHIHIIVEAKQSCNITAALQVLSHKLTPAHRIPALELCDGALRVLGGAWPAASCGEWTEGAQCLTCHNLMILALLAGKFVALLLHIVSVEARHPHPVPMIVLFDCVLSSFHHTQ